MHGANPAELYPETQAVGWTFFFRPQLRTYQKEKALRQRRRAFSTPETRTIRLPKTQTNALVIHEPEPSTAAARIRMQMFEEQGRLLPELVEGCCLDLAGQ